MLPTGPIGPGGPCMPCCAVNLRQNSEAREREFIHKDQPENENRTHEGREANRALHPWLAIRAILSMLTVGARLPDLQFGFRFEFRVYKLTHGNSLEHASPPPPHTHTLFFWSPATCGNRIPTTVPASKALSLLRNFALLGQITLC